MDALQFLLYMFNSCTDICINDCFMLNSSPATSEILIAFDGIQERNMSDLSVDVIAV